MTVSRDDMPSVDPQFCAADMTPQQRLVEIAAILAHAVLRVRAAQVRQNTAQAEQSGAFPPDPGNDRGRRRDCHTQRRLTELPRICGPSP